jgi:hypothetical protein
MVRHSVRQLPSDSFEEIIAVRFIDCLLEIFDSFVHWVATYSLADAVLAILSKNIKFKDPTPRLASFS